MIFPSSCDKVFNVATAIALAAMGNANTQASSAGRKGLRLNPHRRYGYGCPPASGIVSVARPVFRANVYGDCGASSLPRCSMVIVSKIIFAAECQSSSNGVASPVALKYPSASRSTAHKLSSSYFSLVHTRAHFGVVAGELALVFRVMQKRVGVRINLHAFRLPTNHAGDQFAKGPRLY